MLADSEGASVRWRRDYIRTYLERDILQLGPRIPAETLRRFWTMLAHQQSGQLNAASVARALAVDGKTVSSYLDLLVDFLLVRRLQPWHGNVGKRLVKSPRVYVRDSGIVHSLLGISDHEALLSHPVASGSWEGLAIESLIVVFTLSVRPFNRRGTLLSMVAARVSLSRRMWKGSHYRRCAGDCRFREAYRWCRRLCSQWLSRRSVLFNTRKTNPGYFPIRG